MEITHPALPHGEDLSAELLPETIERQAHQAGEVVRVGSLAIEPRAR